MNRTSDVEAEAEAVAASPGDAKTAEIILSLQRASSVPRAPAGDPSSSSERVKPPSAPEG